MNNERSTLRGSPVVSAPGKVFLIGEYAVLEGAPAVVAAVSRHAVGQFIPGIPAETLLVAEAVRAAMAGLGERASALPEGSALVDTTSFTSEGKKLGLGSSAAAAAAAVGAVLEMAGLSVVSHRELCFSLAYEAHLAAQDGLGSGADVAASVHGGIIRFLRPAGGFPVIERVRPPGGFQLVVFAEGSPASTVDLVRAVRERAAQDPGGYELVMAPLKRLANRFAGAMAEDDMPGLLGATRDYGEGMGALGSWAGLPIVSPRIEVAAELAANLGGAAKPSGAGAGDVGIALFAAEAAARAFADRATALGLRLLDLRIDDRGIHRRVPGERTREGATGPSKSIDG
jgi:phosphomevalonate kinase